MRLKLVAVLSMMGAMVPAFAQAQNFIADTRCAVVLASKKTKAEAIADVKQRWNDRNTAIYRSQNGWYAITWKVIPKATSAKHLRRLKERGEAPSDALCSSGKSYLELVGRYKAERDLIVRKPFFSSAGPSSSDDQGGRTPGAPGGSDDVGGTSRVPQRGDDGGGSSRTPQRGDDGGGSSRTPQRGDDGGGSSRTPQRGDDGGGSSRTPQRGDDGGSSRTPQRGDDGGGTNRVPQNGATPRRGPDSSDDLGGLNRNQDRDPPGFRRPDASDDQGGKQFAGVPGRTPDGNGPRSQRREDDRQPPNFARRKSTGTGFAVSRNGHILTNHHVVDNCSGLKVKNHQAELVGSNPEWDLALLQIPAGEISTVAEFAPQAAKLNSDVTVVGFPLTGLLSGLNVTRGAVSSVKGLRGDEARMQISAPVQPGNSGGPVVDRTGAIVGVVVSKLNAKAIAEKSGDIAQNVNFAIRGRLAKDFMTQNNVTPILKQGVTPMDPEDLAKQTASFTVLVSCY